MAMTMRGRIDDFLAQKRIALVGASREAKAFSRGVFRELRQRGYDVVPVNPAAAEVEGVPCYARVQDIAPPVDGALVVTTKAAAEEVARDCVTAGVSRVWLHGINGPADAEPAAVRVLEGEGIAVVAGYCVLMFLPGAGLIHRFHGWLMKLVKTYPQ